MPPPMCRASLHGHPGGLREKAGLGLAGGDSANRSSRSQSSGGGSSASGIQASAASSAAGLSTVVRGDLSVVMGGASGQQGAGQRSMAARHQADQRRTGRG